MSTNNLETTDKPTYNKLLARPNEPYSIISVRQHTLTIDENDVTQKISIGRPTTVPSHNRNADVGTEEDSVGGEIGIIESDYQVPEGKVSKSE